MHPNCEVLIVGAGFFGAVIAERLAVDAGINVCVIDKRSHICGNCYSCVDPETGVECHHYGSHIFHTSNKRCWEYIQRFSRFNGYRHVVHTRYRDRVYTLPINLGTINAFYNIDLTPRDGADFIRQEAERAGIIHPANLEEKAISQIGRPLYEAFFKGYTLKQWETDPCLLPADIITRLPVRFDYNTRYFNDLYEGIPWDGYTRLFERMLDHPRIDVRLNTDFFDPDIRDHDYRLIVYSGPIDRFFDYGEGRLDWRSIRFEVQRHDCSDYQGCPVMNYADSEIPFTRIHEFKHFHTERRPLPCSITYTEYSHSGGPDSDPFYPVDTSRNRELLKAYQRLASREDRVIFGGRLGGYRYLDMDDTIISALDCYENEIRPCLMSRSN
jgi:UDP-galactopyranose mutase